MVPRQGPLHSTKRRWDSVVLLLRRVAAPEISPCECGWRFARLVRSWMREDEGIVEALVFVVFLIITCPHRRWMEWWCHDNAHHTQNQTPQTNVSAVSMHQKNITGTDTHARADTHAHMRTIACLRKTRTRTRTRTCTCRRRRRRNSMYIYTRKRGNSCRCSCVIGVARSYSTCHIHRRQHSGCLGTPCHAQRSRTSTRQRRTCHHDESLR